MKLEKLLNQEQTNSLIYQIASKALSPAPNRTADKWADENRFLPVGSAEPGAWKSDRTPYMRAIYHAASNPDFSKIVVVCGSQMGKSEALLNIIGHRFTDDPTPTLYIGPTEKNINSFSKDRLNKMIQTTPSLYNIMASGKGASLTEKYFNGIRFGLGWAGSATELASHPAGLVLLDERDRMEDTKEGDPVSLAEARTSTFPDSKIIIASTPTIEGASPIASLFNGGSQFYFHWPCPECYHYFIPKLAVMNWDKEGTDEKRAKTAQIGCIHCGCLIGEQYKEEMNRYGVYITKQTKAVKSGRFAILEDGEKVKFLAHAQTESNNASFWVSGICSPWQSFEQRALSYLKAVHSEQSSQIQAVVNTAFGELFVVRGESIALNQIENCKMIYQQDEAISGVLKKTIGIDVQKNRLVYVIRGFGCGGKSWLIKHGELFGDVNMVEVWGDLEVLINEYKPNLSLIDSGYLNQVVYKFCRRIQNCIPTKGVSTMNKPYFFSNLDVDRRGRRVSSSLQLLQFNTDDYKQLVQQQIVEGKNWKIPTDVSDDYLKQVIAEERVVKTNGGIVWLARGRENHYFDCEVLCLLASRVIKVDTLEPKNNSMARKQKVNPFGLSENWITRR